MPGRGLRRDSPFPRPTRVCAGLIRGYVSRVGHEEQAERLEREAKKMERESERMGDRIDEARDDWEAKEQDTQVPGAARETETAPDGEEDDR